jgi:hypothetical protein
MHPKKPGFIIFLEKVRPDPRKSGNVQNTMTADLLVRGYGTLNSIFPQSNAILGEIGAFRKPGIATTRHDLLDISEKALAFLESPQLMTLLESCIGKHAMLSRARFLDLPVQRKAEWSRDFLGPLKDLSPRKLRPGITMLVPLELSGGTVEVVRCSQHLPAGRRPDDLDSVEVPIACGDALVLESGICYRPLAPSAWMDLSFCRSWIKPEIYFISALAPHRLERSSDRVQHLCGKHLGLPVSVQQFLKIEEMALSSTMGKAKGSGV